MTAPKLIDNPLARPFHNRLVAIDAETGLIKWWIGGPTVGAEPIPLAGVYLMGPPAFVDGRAYILGEEGRQIRLYEFDVASGNVLASQDLWNENGSSANAQISHPDKGVTPLVAGHTIICPLNDVVVAVDSVSQSLRWTVPRNAFGRSRFSNRPILNRNVDDSVPAGVIVSDAQRNYPTTLVSDSAVVTESELGFMSLDVVTGRLQWQVATKDVLWLECLTATQVIAVTPRGLMSITLSDGTIGWDQSLPPASGSGLLHDGLLTMPLQTGEIVTLDLAANRLVARTPTRSGSPLGTLVGVAGNTVSFNGRELIGFGTRTLDTGADLPDFAELDDDARADWTGYAAELLHQARGDVAMEILTGLRLRTPDDSQIETLLAAAVLMSFDESAERALEIAKTLDISALPRTTALQLRRILAEKYAADGATLSEARELIRMISLGPTQEARQLEAGRTINAGQQSIARLSRIVETLADIDLENLRKDTTEFIRNADEETHANLAGNMPEELLDSEDGFRLARVATPLARRENLLWRYVDRPSEANSATRDSAVLTLGRLYANAGRAFDLAALEDELTEESAEWSTLVGENNVERLLRITRRWPEGADIDVRTREIISQGNGMAAVKLYRSQHASRSLRHWLAGPQHRDFNLVDPRSQTAESFQTRGPGRTIDRVVYVDTVGHLSVIARPTRFDVVDTLAHPPRVVTSIDLSPENSTSFYLKQTDGLRTTLVADRDGNRYGTAGPLTANVLTFIRGDRLVAIDPYRPARGELWTNANVVPGSELLGDDSVVIARAPESNELTAFDLRDGNSIPAAMLPTDLWLGGSDETFSQNSQCLLGRSVIRHVESETSQQLILFDLIEGNEIWTIDAPADATLIRSDDVIVSGSPSTGQIAVFDVVTGTKLVEGDVRELESPSYAIHRDEHRIFVITGTPPTEVLRDIGPSERHARPIGNTAGMLANGPLIAFDLSELKVLWTRDVKDQQIPTAQPAGWPFIVAASAYVKPEDLEVSNKIRNGTRVELIDKRTGKTVWKDEALPYSNVLRWEPRRGGLPGTRIRFSDVSLDVSPLEVADEPTPPTGNTEPGNAVPSTQKKGVTTSGEEKPGDKSTTDEDPEKPPTK